MTRYRTIVADPPWAYDDGFVTQANHQIKGRLRTAAEREPGQRKPLPYQSMSIEAIRALPVATWADVDSRLFLWTTNRYLPQALSLLPSWGFIYRQTLVWDKTPNFPRLPASVAPNAAEFLVVATAGAPERLGTWASSVIRARKPRAVHSEKPDVFLDLVEQVSPSPYLEMFARRARFGWDYWGDESLGTVELSA